MDRFVRTLPLLALAVLVGGACAVRLGGPAPQEYNALAVAAPANATAAEVGAQLRARNAQVVLLAAGAEDTTWYRQVAEAARLTPTRPGVIEGRGFAFMSNLELLGDTTLTLNVPEGGTIAMHDALYRVDQHRYLNTMTVRMDAPDLRAAVRALFGYIASDVMGNAALLVAVDGPTAAAADSVALLMRATLTTAAECERAELPPELPVRLLYGPAARMACRAADDVDGAATGIHARVIVGR